MESINQKLQELILDENKIVTYKTLSKVCSIHVNFAKKALEQFLDVEPGLNACYLLTGSVGEKDTPESGGYQVAVVSASKLDAVRQKFSNVDSCHVYSLQKAIIKDVGILYGSGKDDLTEPLKSRPPVIKNSLIGQSRHQQKPIPVKTAPVPSQHDCPTKTNGVVSGLGSGDASLTEKASLIINEKQNKKNSGKSKVSANGKGIMAAFAKGVAKKTSPSSAKASAAKSSPILTSQTKAKEAPLASAKQLPDNKELVKKAEKQMWSSSESDQEEVIPEIKKKPEKKQNKKMKRIVQLPQDSDSEEEIKKPTKRKKFARSPSSDDVEKLLPANNGSPALPIEEDDDEEEVIPPTPEPPKISKQYTTVTNTYEDEEGFLVTRKERKLEEVEVVVPPPLKKVTSNNNIAQPKKRQKKSPDSGGKIQATLMTFFKKT